MMSFDLNVDMNTLLLSNVLQGISIGVSWVPLTVITFWTLAPEYRAEAMSMFHLLRNFGSSLFISIAVAEIVRTSAANYARMVRARLALQPRARHAVGDGRAGPSIPRPRWPSCRTRSRASRS